MKIVQLLDKHFLPWVSKNWDDQVFRDRILKVIGPDTKLLDVGAGAGIIGQ